MLYYKLIRGWGTFIRLYVMRVFKYKGWVYTFTFLTAIVKSRPKARVALISYNMMFACIIIV